MPTSVRQANAAMAPVSPTAAERAGSFVALCADGPAFRAWYDAALPRVFGYVHGRVNADTALAEEITQQAFISAIDARHRFDGRADPVTWICAIARNALLDHYRRLAREERLRLRVVVGEIRDPAKEWEQRDERAEVVAALRSLTTDQRAAVLLRYADGLPVREVARLIERSEPATESLLSRSRERLRALLEVPSRDR
jgi:RNA polymerase sigma-70 factor, ECF subfamily